MRYFDHDTTASMDDKIIVLRLEQGNTAVDVYWTLLEKMYHDEAPVNLDETNPETKALTVRLAVGLEDIKTYVSYMISIGLFETVNGDENLIVSKRAMENIAAYREKCETARQNGKKGGRKPKGKPSEKPTANRPLTEGKPNAKLRKEKKDIGFDKQNQISTAYGADAENSAPSAVDLNAISDEVDEQYSDLPKAQKAIAATLEFRRQHDELVAGATSCPADVLAQVQGVSA